MKKKYLMVLIMGCSIIVNVFSQGNQEDKSKPFNFSDSFHSLGFSVFTGINFAPKLLDNLGEIEPILFHAFVPEFVLQYNFMIKNNFGIALEIPFGVFKRTSLTKLSNYGASNDVWLNMGALYIGFIAKLTVFKELSKNICMQGELGIKFNPFYHPANQWENRDYDVYNSHGYEIEEDNSSINFIKVEQKYYGVPDATVAVLFFFHCSKRPKHNFVLGVNANLSFVKRIKVSYDTRFSELGINEIPYIGLGNYGWNSSAVGITLGYRFFGIK